MKNITFSKKKAKLLITGELFLKIQFLCNQVHDREWSGYLFYTVEQDKKNKSLALVGKDLVLKDIGTTAATSFEPSPDDISIWEEKPERENWRSGLVHSHHNMEAFFSGVDMKELEDNSKDVDFYLSLIVNNKPADKWVAKLAKVSLVKTETRYSYMDKIKNSVFNWGKSNNIVEENVLNTIDCEIQVDVPEYREIEENHKNILVEKEKALKNTVGTWNGFAQGNSYPYIKPPATGIPKKEPFDLTDNAYTVLLCSNALENDMGIMEKVKEIDHFFATSIRYNMDSLIKELSGAFPLRYFDEDVVLEMAEELLGFLERYNTNKKSMVVKNLVDKLDTFCNDNAVWQYHGQTLSGNAMDKMDDNEW